MPIFDAQTIGWYNPIPEHGNGPVRHVHPPGAKNWHEAHESHGVTPGSPSDPHIIYKVYDEANIKWGKLNAHLTLRIKRDLVAKAKLAYENGTIGPRYDLPEAPKPQESSTNGADPDVIARLEAIEDVMLGTAQSVNDHDKLLADLATGNKNGQPHVTPEEFNALKLAFNELKESRPQRIEIFDHTNRETHKIEGTSHQDFVDLLDAVQSMAAKRRQFWLAGPAGSGKSFLVEQIAATLKLRCDGYGAILNIIKLEGYTGLNGEYFPTIFYDYFVNGGVLYLDECDASVPEVMNALNMALANGYYSFPLGTNNMGGRQKRHPNFYCFATANTLGAGADAQYSGRFKQDAAFLDRFIVYPLDYDPTLEKNMIDPLAWEWVEIVQKVRQASREASGSDAKAGFVISPRASEKGQDLILNSKLSRRKIVNMVFGQYVRHDRWAHIGRAAEDWVAREPVKTNLNSVNFNSR